VGAPRTASVQSLKRQKLGLATVARALVENGSLEHAKGINVCAKSYETKKAFPPNNRG
jgi:hypothetical protein